MPSSTATQHVPTFAQIPQSPLNVAPGKYGHPQGSFQQPPLMGAAPANPIWQPYSPPAPTPIPSPVSRPVPPFVFGSPPPQDSVPSTRTTRTWSSHPHQRRDTG
ncbi:hypothetical protein EHS25_006089 [Saitozyma podzolica]|uniref:Uncharacterized protein n=1 Tax=Saitozyma podzolica TaxID=1890683 RepID=A0A427XTC6_9TREE|nr:hypothetical protein EHS25_006089 [Saitozyma podzolica]